MGDDEPVETITRRARLRLATIPVWVVAIVGAVIVGMTVHGDRYLVWLPLVLGATVILTFALQLATREKDGLVDRAMLSLAGSFRRAVASMLSLLDLKRCRASRTAWYRFPVFLSMLYIGLLVLASACIVFTAVTVLVKLFKGQPGCHTHFPLHSPQDCVAR